MSARQSFFKAYKELVSELQNRYDKVHFVTLSMGALGTMGSSSSSFLNMLMNLDFDEKARSFKVKRVINISIRTIYCIFVVGIRYGQTQNFWTFDYFPLHAVDILFYFLYLIRHTFCKLHNISEVYNCIV